MSYMAIDASEFYQNAQISIVQHGDLSEDISTIFYIFCLYFSFKNFVLLFIIDIESRC